MLSEIAETPIASGVSASAGGSGSTSSNEPNSFPVNEGSAATGGHSPSV